MAQEWAERFDGYVPDDYSKQPLKVLYIGKATAGDLRREQVEGVFNDKSSPFWTFATEVSKATGGDGRNNLAWSNLFKRGVLNGNPRGTMVDVQRDESVEALRQDVAKTKADLIVLVTVGYHEEIPKQAFEILDGEAKTEGDQKLKTTAVAGEKYSIWTRPAHGAFPPIVWISHPQGKSTEYRDAALAEIRRILKLSS